MEQRSTEAPLTQALERVVQQAHNQKGGKTQERRLNRSKTNFTFLRESKESQVSPVSVIADLTLPSPDPPAFGSCVFLPPAEVCGLLKVQDWSLWPFINKKGTYSLFFNMESL